MSRIRTRAQLAERVRRSAGVQSDEASTVNRYLAEAWAMAWREMVMASDAIGIAREDFTIVDQEPIAMPSVFLSLTSLVVWKGGAVEQSVFPELLTWKQIDRGPNRLLTPGAVGPVGYMLEGPGIEWDGATYAQYGLRLRFVPPLTVGDVVVMTFVTQEPSLGDPDVPADDSTQVDVFAESVERVLVGYARLGVTGRLKDKEYERAAGELRVAAVQAAEDLGGRNQQGPRLLRNM